MLLFPLASYPFVHIQVGMRMRREKLGHKVAEKKGNYCTHNQNKIEQQKKVWHQRRKVFKKKTASNLWRTEKKKWNTSNNHLDWILRRRTMQEIWRQVAETKADTYINNTHMRSKQKRPFERIVCSIRTTKSLIFFNIFFLVPAVSKTNPVDV